MNLDEINKVYLIGGGGIGMSALGRYFNAKGMLVFGYDRVESELTKSLEKEGMAFHYQDRESCIPDQIKSSKEDTLVIYTPAVPNDSNELNFFIENGFEVKKRSEVLGMITMQYKTIAVAGTHGKTTTSSMILHILKTAGKKCIGFLGGVSQNYNSNFVMDEGAEWVVTEADEYDRSFLTLHPEIAVITSLDADHLDVYQTEKSMHRAYFDFAEKVKTGGELIIHTALKALEWKTKSSPVTYALEYEADVKGDHVGIKDGRYHFEVEHEGKRIRDMECGLPGRHNVENGVAAIAVALELGVEEPAIREGLKSFTGVKRRFEYHIKTDELVYIDDYAHHPEELKECIESARELYPGKKLTGIFQPHLYSRTRDFADEFAAALEKLDEVILLEIYPAREAPVEGVNAKMLLEKIRNKNKSISDREGLLLRLENDVPEVLMTMGAGDIDRLVDPIRETLKKQTGQYQLN